MIDAALADAQISLADLSAVAVAHTPGLAGAILVGLSAAKALSLALEIPFFGVNHLEGHLYACQLAHDRPAFPSIGLVISGGHTHLFDCRSPSEHQLIGATVDDAAGEAFDKAATAIGLGYPGGPAIERAAKTGNPNAYAFPRSMIHEPTLDFSFSGLKTAVRYAIHGKNTSHSDRRLSVQEQADLAASFQAAVIDVVVSKCQRALRESGRRVLCVGGGVAANGALRAALQRLADQEKIDVLIPPVSWCTDNAAMAAVVVDRFKRGAVDPLDLDAQSGVIRSPRI